MTAMERPATEPRPDRPIPPPPAPFPPRRGGGRRVALAVFVGLLALVATGLVALDVAVSRRPLPPDRTAQVSATVLDRHDALLRAFTTPSGHWRLPIAPTDVDPRYLAMLTAFEDRRFARHRGVDLLAMGRAAVQLLTHGRIVSGGSTLTMQTARLMRGPERRSAGVKLRQVLDALRMERTLSKREILTRYLTLAPFGGNMEGVRTASIAYLGKEPRRLSPAEAALLVAIPQSPEARRPDRFPAAARRARDRVLARVRDLGLLSPAEFARAIAEPVPTVRREMPIHAAHLAETEHHDAPDVAVHRTTLDRDLQRGLETLARDHAAVHGAKLSAAVVVADHKTGDILARVGSAGYLDAARWGPIDMVTAVRSPGSTLKPFIYGLGFESGFAHPETLIEDRPVRFGAYRPKNFDEEFHGTVTVRDALARSLNIPAVKMLSAVGPGRLHGRLRRAGATPELPSDTAPTLAIALGGLGLTLHDLTALYAALARGGEPATLRHRRAPSTGGRPARASAAVGPQSRQAERIAETHRRVLSPVAAWYVTDILKDAPPPVHARAGRLAYKTGTSYGYRDAYAIGYDGRHVVAVWIGRPDSAATPGLSGRTAAAPLLFDAFARLGEHRAPLPPPPKGVITAAGADLPPPLKRFREPWAEGDGSRPAGAFLEPAPVIAFPPDRSEIELPTDSGAPPATAATGAGALAAAAAAAAEDADADETGAGLVLRADGGTLPLTWLINDAPIPSEPFRREVVWRGSGRGFVTVSVIDAAGRADRVVVRLR